jgi:DNA ligase (NAD+)
MSRSPSQTNILASLDETEADLLEQAIPILDDLYAAGGEPDCILPPEILDELRAIPRYAKLVNPVSNTFYDEMRYTRLPALRPDSEVLKSQAGVEVDLTQVKATIKHDPPMTSIDKANGSVPVKYRVLGKWLYDCLIGMGHKVVADLSVLNDDDPAYDINKAASLVKKLGEMKDAAGVPIFAMSYKRDGVSCRLYYEKGKLVHAGVRPNSKGPGAGVIAADIIDHVRGLKGVPDTLPQPINIAIGGELEILLSEFEKVNAAQAAAGEKTFANTRNACAGAMNALGDPGVPKHRRVQFLAHNIERHDKPPYKLATDRALWVNKELKAGFTFVRVEPFKFESIAKMEELAPELDYEVDGIVFEVNDLEHGENLGRRGGSAIGNPVWKIAWKFAEQSAVVTIKSVRWQVGRTGKFTPVAEFDGVRLAGTNVTNCTLHNLGKVQHEHLGVGAQGQVYKSGKIIPYWAGTLKPAPKVDHPHSCPYCSTKTIIEEHDEERIDPKTKAKGKVKVAELFCPNGACPARNSLTFVHFLSGIGVKGVAEDVVNMMMAAGLLKTHADFFRVSPQQLKAAGASDREAVLALARIHKVPAADKEKDNQKLLDKAKRAASEKKVLSLGAFVAALGIAGAGKGTGRELQDHFGTIDKVLAATAADFEQVPNVGASTAKLLEDYFTSNRAALNDLLKYIEIEKPRTGKFSGMTFVLTGSPPNGKEHWEKLIEADGGKCSGSVSRKTNVVIVGPDSKADRAAKYVKALELKDLWDKGDQKKGADITIIDDPAELNKFFGLDKDDDRAF